MALKPTVKPRFATSDLNNGPLGGPNVLEPGETKKDSGWLAGEKPPRETFNWLHRLTYQWIDWLDETASNSLQKTSNLSDLTNTATARTNLGLGTAAVANTGTLAANVPTITDADGRYARRSNNLSDLTSAATARTNLGLGTAAVTNTGTSSSNVPTIAIGDARWVSQTQQATETLAGVAEVATAAEAAVLGAGAIDTVMLTPQKLRQAFLNNASYSTNGYQRLPGGLIMQWGTSPSMNAADVQIISLPISFPNAILNLQCSLARTTTEDSDDVANAYISQVSLSQIRLVMDAVEGTIALTPVYWFAIGY